MPQPPKYLSTDPNAGLDNTPSQGPRYLSTDPHAGLEPTATTEDPRHPSTIGGFLREAALTAIPLYGPARAAGLDLPTAAGIAGGIATGGAGLIPEALAAAAGGGAGSIAKNAIEYFRGAKPNATAAEVAKDVALDAAKQGGVQLAGGVAGNILRVAGRHAYGLALSPAKALADEFGRRNLAETGIELGAIPGTEWGTRTAEAARAASGQEARNILQASPAAQAGVRVTTPSLAQGLDPLRAAAAAKPTANVAQQQINDFASNLAASHPQGFSLEELLATKRAAQDEAQAAYKAARQGGNRMAGMDAEANEAIAARARQILEHFAPETGPVNAQTQRLIGVSRALSDAENRSPLMRAILALPTGGASLLTLPPVGGTLGILADRAGQRAVAPNLLRAAIVGMLGTDQAPATTTP